jgi:hypothetical protein
MKLSSAMLPSVADMSGFPEAAIEATCMKFLSPNPPLAQEHLTLQPVELTPCSPPPFCKAITFSSEVVLQHSVTKIQ